MLFADHYSSVPNLFHTRPIVELVKQDPQRRFAGGADDIFVWPKRKTRDFLDEILPAHAKPVIVNCFWFSGGPTQLRASMLIFCAERGMLRLLKTKHDTDGLNTSKLQGMNCHIHAYPDHKTIGGVATIAKDRTFNARAVRPSIVDVLLSLMSVEGYRNLTVSDVIGSPLRIK